MSIALSAPIRSTSDLDTVTRWADDLPRMASDPRVTVVCDLGPYTVGCCGNCWERDETWAEWQITYTATEGGSVQTVDVCGSSCADEKLTELLERGLYARRVYAVTLRLPFDWAPVPVDSDELTNLADVRCEGQPGCTSPVSYAVAWDGNLEARRECTCRDHLAALVDYAEKFGRVVPVTVSALSVSDRELVAA